MSADKKRLAAEAALHYIQAGMILGIGTGSTVNQLMEALQDRKIQLSGAVSSSRQTSEKLRAARRFFSVAESIFVPSKNNCARVSGHS